MIYNSAVGDAAVDQILLVTIQQMSDYSICADYDGNIVTKLTGPLDLVKWRDLRMVVHAIQAALVRANLLSEYDIRIDSCLGRREKGWSPKMEIWAASARREIIDIAKIKTVIEVVLSGLKRDASNVTVDMHTKSLDALEVSSLNDVIKETLCANGGSKLSAPISIGIENEHFEFIGKLGMV